MNKTKNGRWGRYKTIKGEEYKLCNGPLHSEDGAWLPLRSYFILKNGKRKGKPISQCQACERVRRGLDAEGGLVSVDRVWFIFRELEFRIGRAETCRRLGVSQNLWYRAERRIYKNMYRKTAKAAMLLLRELRDNEVVRHKNSIRSGASMRGRRERVPSRNADYNGPDNTEAIRSKNRRRAA